MMELPIVETESLTASRINTTLVYKSNSSAKADLILPKEAEKMKINIIDDVMVGKTYSRDGKWVVKIKQRGKNKNKN